MIWISGRRVQSELLVQHGYEPNAKLSKHQCALDELAGYPVNTSVAWQTTTCSTHGSIHTQVT